MTGSAAHVAVGRPELAGLINASHLNSPSDFAALVAAQARSFGACDVVLYLVDYGQTHLVPVPSPAAADRGALSIDGSLAGRTFRSLETLEGDGSASGLRRFWVPLLDGTERLGVVEYSFDRDAVPIEDLHERLFTYSGLVADLIVSRQFYGDVFEFVRRTRPMSLAAEIQWRLLPPLTFGTDRIVISGVLEPWDEVGGDTFDYAVNGELAYFAVFDAMGHGLGAALVSSVAVAAYRNARRALLGLEETYRALDTALNAHFGGERFVTALLAELDIPEGRLRWLSAGHPSPLLVRSAKLIDRLDVDPARPLGMPFDVGPLAVAEESLEPGDRVVFYTDGVVEARDAQGQFFGVERLGDLVVREAHSGMPAPEVLRRLGRAILDHQQGRLQDDATTLLVEWSGGGERALLP